MDSSLPERNLSLWRIATEPDVDLRKVAIHASTVPDVAAAIVRYANSAYVGAAFPVGTVLGAVVRVGSRTVGALALAAASRGLMGGWGTAENWEDALVVGRAARLTGRLAGVTRDESEELFVAGLFSGIGTMQLSQRDSGYLPWRRRLISQGHFSEEIVYREEMVYGADHAAMSGRILTQWGFPTNVAAAVAAHHRPSESKVEKALAAAMAITGRESEIGGCIDSDFEFSLSTLNLEEHATFIRTEATLFAEAAVAAVIGGESETDSAEAASG
jgi:HD-like signal output (HDOD) protein